VWCKASFQARLQIAETARSFNLGPSPMRVRLVVKGSYNHSCTLSATMSPARPCGHPEFTNN